MPCYDGSQPTYHTPYYEVSESSQERKDRDVMARLACVHCKYLKKAGIPIPEWAKDWWERHQEFDRLRLVRERQKAVIEARRARARALAKLDKEDKDALGLSD